MPSKLRPKVEILADLERRIAPVALAREKTLATSEHFSSFLPAGGLVSGSTAALKGRGATSVAFALLAEASRQGAWTACMGLHHLGWAAAAGAGMCLTRMVSITGARSSDAWVDAMAAMVDSFDVVIFDPLIPVSARNARRLVARVRERGTVLVELSSPDGQRRYRWPTSPDQVMTCETLSWEGIGTGHGSLGGRRVSVSLDARRGVACRREFTISPDGSLGPFPGGAGRTEERQRLRAV